MTNGKLGNVTIKDARIIFRNFAGEEGQYNRKGDRNFAVVLPEDVGEAMLNDGWNVKYLKAREEGDSPTPYLSVSVNFKNRPPRCVMVTTRGRTSLPEEMVEVLDWVDISKVDLIVNPYQWAVSGKTGVKAYLKAIYVTILEDELERQYADIPEIDLQGKPLQITTGHSEDDILDLPYTEVLEIEG